MFRQVVPLLALLAMASAHMRLLDPAARSSLWRFEEYAQYNPEPNYSDDEIWCANVRQMVNVTNCGVCGDAFDRPVPRDNEWGGRWGKGIVAKTYNAGDTIPIHLESYAPHGGYVEVHICDKVPETEDCFRPMVLSNGDTKWMMRLGDGDFNIHTTAKLPDGMKCQLPQGICVVRMHYRGAQHWGTCDNSAGCECDPNSGNPPGGMGCSEQQTFRSCADIMIN